MKVALLTAWLSESGGGIPPVVRALASELRRLDGDTAVELLGLRHPADPPCEGAVSIKGPRFFAYSPEVRGRLRAGGCDLLHQHGLWLYPSLAACDWARATERPRMISPHGMLDPWALRNSAWKKRIAWFLYEGRNLRGASCLHALNAREARAIRACGLRNPVAIVPNGVELPALEPPRSERAERILLFLGRLDPKKRVRELVRAWALAGVARLGWRLRIVGWGHPGYVKAIRDLVEELGVERSVDLPGPAFGQEKSRVLREADAFVLPSVSEGLPMAVLEAWSHALPVIMTPQCNLPEGFTAGAALEVEPEPSSIAEGIRDLVHLSEADRTRMGRAGRELVEEQFTWPSVARRMRKVYGWVLGGGRPPSCVMTD